MHKSRRYVRHRLHYSHFKSIRSQVCRAEKKDAFNAGQWLQVSDVTDSWPIIVSEIWCVWPPKAFCCQGNLKQPLDSEERNVMIALRDTDTTLSHRRRREELQCDWASLQQHLAAGISLTCQREATCCFVSDCHIPLTLMLLLTHMTSISPPGVFHILFNEQ